MKILRTLLFSLMFISCTRNEYTKIEQEIIDGKVSAITKGHIGRITTLLKIWVQNTTNTIMVEIPFEYENRWEIGDSCLLIIEKYKENTK